MTHRTFPRRQKKKRLTGMTIKASLPCPQLFSYSGLWKWSKRPPMWSWSCPFPSSLWSFSSLKMDPTRIWTEQMVKCLAATRLLLLWVLNWARFVEYIHTKLTEGPNFYVCSHLECSGTEGLHACSSYWSLDLLKRSKKTIWEKFGTVYTTLIRLFYSDY